MTSRGTFWDSSPVYADGLEVGLVTQRNVSLWEGGGEEAVV